MFTDRFEKQRYRILFSQFHQTDSLLGGFPPLFSDKMQSSTVAVHDKVLNLAQKSFG